MQQLLTISMKYPRTGGGVRIEFLRVYYHDNKLLALIYAQDCSGYMTSYDRRLEYPRSSYSPIIPESLVRRGNVELMVDLPEGICSELPVQYYVVDYDHVIEDEEQAIFVDWEDDIALPEGATALFDSMRKTHSKVEAMKLVSRLAAVDALSHTLATEPVSNFVKEADVTAASVGTADEIAQVGSGVVRDHETGDVLDVIKAASLRQPVEFDERLAYMSASREHESAQAPGAGMPWRWGDSMPVSMEMLSLFAKKKPQLGIVGLPLENPYRTSIPEKK